MNKIVLSQPYCMHPFTNLTIDTGGIIRLCCATDSQVGQLSEIDDIEDFWYNSTILNDVRQRMTRNEPAANNACSTCIRNEKFGLISRRLHYSEKIMPLVSHSDNVTKDLKMLHMDIAFSRTCNLQCVTCDSNFSSKWFLDDQKRINLFPEKFDHLKSVVGKNSVLSSEHINQLIELTKITKKIVVKGGEPFLDSGFKKFILGIKNKESKRFVCVTNGTIYDTELIDEIKKFEQLTMVISIDAPKKNHQWIRKCDDSMYDNIEKFSTYLNKVSFNTVVSAFNIFSLDKLIENILNENRFNILKLGMRTILSEVEYSFFIFNQKFYPLIIQKLEKVKKLVLEDSRDIVDIASLDNIINLINSNKFQDHRSIKNMTYFLEHYENILVPSRGHCLSTIDPLFGEALEDLKCRI